MDVESIIRGSVPKGISPWLDRPESCLEYALSMGLDPFTGISQICLHDFGDRPIAGRANVKEKIAVLAHHVN
jgi:hypothetical protein